MLVVRGVPFPIIERLQVSLPLNSRPVAYYRKGGTTTRLRLFLRGVQHLFQFGMPGHLQLYLVYLMLTMMTHNFSFFLSFFLSLVPSSVELTLTSLACGSLAGSF